jgi:hypothetical protein
VVGQRDSAEPRLPGPSGHLFRRELPV